MTGLFLIAVLLTWLAVCVWLVKKITNLLPKKWWSAGVRFLVIAVLLPLPGKAIKAAVSPELISTIEAVYVGLSKVFGSYFFLQFFTFIFFG